MEEKKYYIEIESVIDIYIAKELLNKIKFKDRGLQGIITFYTESTYKDRKFNIKLFANCKEYIGSRELGTLYNYEKINLFDLKTKFK